jgi:hypothetical protein
MFQTQALRSKNKAKPDKGKPRGLGRASASKSARTSVAVSAPPAELSADSESESECPSPGKKYTSDERPWYPEFEVVKFFKILAENDGPLFKLDVELVVKFLSGIKRPLTTSEYDQLSKALGISTLEELRVFVSDHFLEETNFSAFIDLKIKRSMNGGNAFGCQKWMRYEQTKPNPNAVKQTQQHYEQKELQWTKDFEKALKNTQTVEMRENTLTTICAAFGMPPGSLRWLAASRFWFTQNPDDFLNAFWQQLQAAKQIMHTKIQDKLSSVICVRKQQSTPAEREQVLLELSQALGYQRSMLPKFAKDTMWSKIKTGGQECEFQLAYNNLLAQCEKKQEEAKKKFLTTMRRRDEIVRMRLRALRHLASAALKFSNPKVLDQLAYTDIFDTYDPANPNDEFTQVLKELRDYGESTVGGIFIGK